MIDYDGPNADATFRVTFEQMLNAKVVASSGVAQITNPGTVTLALQTGHLLANARNAAQAIAADYPDQASVAAVYDATYPGRTSPSDLFDRISSLITDITAYITAEQNAQAAGTIAWSIDDNGVPRWGNLSQQQKDALTGDLNTILANFA